MRTMRRVEHALKGAFRTRQQLDGAGEREFPAFRALDVEQIALTYARG